MTITSLLDEENTLARAPDIELPPPLSVAVVEAGRLAEDVSGDADPRVNLPGPESDDDDDDDVTEDDEDDEDEDEDEEDDDVGDDVEDEGNDDTGDDPDRPPLRDQSDGQRIREPPREHPSTR